MYVTNKQILIDSISKELMEFDNFNKLNLNNLNNLMASFTYLCKRRKKLIARSYDRVHVYQQFILVKESERTREGIQFRQIDNFGLVSYCFPAANYLVFIAIKFTNKICLTVSQ